MRLKKKSGVGTVIANGDCFEGSLRIEGGLQVDGELVGNVDAVGVVIVGPDGVVKGEIEADEVVVSGRAEGRVVARGNLHVRETGHVEGDALFATLQVDRGGVILGQTASSSVAHAAAETEDEEDEAGERVIQLEA